MFNDWSQKESVYFYEYQNHILTLTTFWKLQTGTKRDTIIFYNRL